MSERDDQEPEETSRAEAATTDEVPSVAPTPEPSSAERPEPPQRAERAEAPLAAPRRLAAWLPLAFAFVTPFLLFFVVPPLTRAGLWDPYELNVADLARRIALNLHGAAGLALEGADNSLPHLNDLGRPQLPFTSIALGFKLFELHEWAGRAPLALWGLFGVLATYGFVARLVDRRAGVFSAVILSTMPLYFVQARTMLGDIVTMSAFAMAFGGLAVAVFGRREDDRKDLGVRAAWLALAGLGLVAGWFTRGGLVSVGAPSFAVGAAWALSRANGGRRGDALANAVGVVSLVLGAVTSFIALRAMQAPPSPDLNPWVGAMVHPPGKYPTYDFMLGHVAVALAPWSAFAPFAIGRLFMAPVGREGEARERESQARLLVLVGAGVTFAAHGWMAARTDLVAFAGASVIAVACGMALRDYERGAHPSVAVGVGTAVLLALFRHEFKHLPEKAFHAFAVVAAAFPESFKQKSTSLWAMILMGFAAVAFLAFAERDSDREPFAPKNYVRVLVSLRDAWDGMLALAYFALVAGASLAGLAVWVGTRYHAKWLPSLGSQTREAVMNGWWVTAFVPLGVIFGLFFWSDVFLWAIHRVRPAATLGKTLARGFEPLEDLAAKLQAGRLRETLPALAKGTLEVTYEKPEDGEGPMALFVLAPLMYLQVPAAVFGVLSLKLGMKWPVAAALAVPSGVLVFLALGAFGALLRGSRATMFASLGVAFGTALCFVYYPALANQLSPKEVFESYQRAQKQGEPLALFGVGGRTAAYYAGGQPLILKDVTSAYEWLMAEDGLGGATGRRRFLAVRAEELARLNRVYRERHGGAGNLPVLDARSSQILLVASALAPGEKNDNPLDKIVLSPSAAVKPQRPLDANLDDRLLVLGYDIVDANGRLVESVSPGKPYVQRTYFKVLAPVMTDWEMFIHIDGYRRRHIGDHKVTAGKYPMSLWLPNDIIVDEHEIKLEPNFTPGAYTDYFGLYLGDSRMQVKSGPSDNENRINGGVFRVK